MKMQLFSLLFLLLSCASNEPQKSSNPDDTTHNITVVDSGSYIMFGQYSNDNNSRWKQLYKITSDSNIYLHFKGGEYFDYQTNTWVPNVKVNVSNLPLNDLSYKGVFPLIKGISNVVTKYDSLIGDPMTIEDHGMYIEIRDKGQKRYWKINEWDKNIPSDIKSVDDKLRKAIGILDPETKD